MKRIFVCSRYAGNVTDNELTAEWICRAIALRGDAPMAPHLLYPRFLHDYNPGERQMGLGCSLAWLSQCDEMHVCAEDGISDGMKAEIDQAQALGLPIVYVNEDGEVIS